MLHGRVVIVENDEVYLRLVLHRSEIVLSCNQLNIQALARVCVYVCVSFHRPCVWRNNITEKKYAVKRSKEQKNYYLIGGTARHRTDAHIPSACC